MSCRPGRPLRAALAVLLTALALALTLTPSAARAADVVVVRSSDQSAFKAVEQAFAAELPAAKSLLATAPGLDLKAELAGAKLVLAVGPDAARAVMAAHGGVPVLVALAAEAELAGAKPAGIVPMFVAPARQVKLAKAFLPTLARVGIVYDPSKTRAMASEFESAAKAAGLTLEKSEVTSRGAVIDAARAMMPKIDVLWLLPDSTVVGLDTFKVLIATTVAAKVGLVGFTEGMARTGAVLSIEASYAEIGRRAAAAGKRLLAGGAAAPEAPEGAAFVNAKTAELIGLTLSPKARAEAAKVFE
ncbi:MAG TPA: ABC transporter substrate binding protein [Myxococcales bacterium]